MQDAVLLAQGKKGSVALPVFLPNLILSGCDLLYLASISFMEHIHHPKLASLFMHSAILLGIAVLCLKACRLNSVL